MEAPRGVEVSSERGQLRVSGRKDLQLESTEGEVSRPPSTLLLFHENRSRTSSVVQTLQLRRLGRLCSSLSPPNRSF